jgi:Phosphotransferase system IIB components
MSNYRDMANDILKDIGGKDNVINVNHCATRLRIQYKAKDQIDDNSVSKIEGVAGTVIRDDEYQIVIGTDVANVYNEFVKSIGDVSNNKSSNIKFTWKHLGQTIIDFISGTFVPILGVLVAAGLVSAVLNIGVSLLWTKY